MLPVTSRKLENSRLSNGGPIREWARKHQPRLETAKYLGLLALAVALFDWKTLLTRQFTFLIGSEPVNLTYSWLSFWVRSVRHLQLPLWDPYAFAGHPFAGEMLPSAYYPLHLVLALLPFNRNGLFSASVYNDTRTATHLLCACFMFALLRDFGRTRFSSFVGACCFALGGIIARLLWLPYVESGIWLPVIFLFLLRALEAEQQRLSILYASLSGAGLGMSVLAGGLHMSMMQGIVVVTAALYGGANARLPWRRIGLILAIALGAAAGIGAVQLLPSQEYSHLTTRFIEGGAIPSSEKIPYNRLNLGMWPQSVVAVLIPQSFGGRLGGGEIWSPYIGVLPFLLAVAGIWKCWPNVWVRYFSGLAVLAYVYSCAEFSPLHGVLYALVPYLWIAREASRFLYLAAFALAILAAFGLDTFLNAREHAAEWVPAMRLLKWAAITCGIALLVPTVFAQVEVNIWTCLSLILIMTSCGWFAYLLRRPATAPVRFILAAFILFDLNAFNWLPQNRADLRKSGDQLDQMNSLRGVASFLKSRPELYRVRVGVSPEPNIGDAYEVPSVWGGGSGVITSYARLSATRPFHALLNVRYIVRPSSAKDPGPVYQDGNWKVYENPGAYPRAWVVHQAVVESSPDAVFQRLQDPAIDWLRTAVVDEPLTLVPRAGSGAAETVHFRSYEANRMTMDVTTESGGLLVLSEIAYPGWRATVNGRPAEIHTVDGALRGLTLAGGLNRVTLTYAPFSFYFGGVLTVLSMAAVLGGLLYLRRSR
ncbi:MAG TPA: YfhO family protein [Bryobacteraceae bacterium]|nr:YfhO family protein [Bryobacteraceae bacterium]